MGAFANAAFRKMIGLIFTIIFVFLFASAYRVYRFFAINRTPIHLDCSQVNSNWKNNTYAHFENCLLQPGVFLKAGSGDSGKGIKIYPILASDSSLSFFLKTKEDYTNPSLIVMVINLKNHKLTSIQNVQGVLYKNDGQVPDNLINRTAKYHKIPKTIFVLDATEKPIALWEFALSILFICSIAICALHYIGIINLQTRFGWLFKLINAIN